MTETKFTPGPWDVEEMPSGRVTVTAGQFFICGDENSYGVIDANAHLIAAAPELYEALETAIEEIKHLRKLAGDNGAMIDDTDFVEGIAALSKARGEA